jgi:hypothetical protein
MRLSTALACITAALGGAACRGTLEAIDLPRDLTVNVKQDLSESTDDGGPPMSTVTMFPDVAGNIQNDIDVNNCATGSCHLAGSVGPGATMSLTPMPATSTAKMTNYMQIMAEIPSGTPAAMTPLMVYVGDDSGGHPGGDLISPTVNPTAYSNWVAWITAGAPEGSTQ